MKQLMARPKNVSFLMVALTLGFVGFGIGYQLFSRADSEAVVKAEVVDSRERIRDLVQQACQTAGKSITGPIDDVRVLDTFAQTTAFCVENTAAPMQPTFYTFKQSDDSWQLIAQGNDPPSAVNPPDAQLPPQFTDGE